MKKLKGSRYISRSTKDSFFIEEKKKRRFVPFIIVGTILAALIVFAVVGLRYGGKIVVTSVTVESAQLPESFDGYRILQISDLHGKEFGEGQKNLRKVIEDQKYDMVIFTGDYNENLAEQEYFIRDLVACFDQTVPMYYILGDCDYRPANASENSERWKLCIDPPVKTPIMTVFEDCGVKFVYPARKITNSAGDFIYLTGISYNKETMNAMEFDMDTDFSICVTHKPIYYNVTNRLKDVNKRSITEIDYDLCISGHTMGGQYRIPILGALYSDDEGWFPQETSLRGLSKDNAGRYNYICGGLGVESGFRFFSNPEISIIELKRAEENSGK
ncbi:MAG: metallophosphoesterase [Clostridia bacterium]|nr:metallophosphoesterase [Clostridia bacterium]